tara:strand:- start:105 stop:533 length:429 start_codon:yes stop_codon:yes gene_type:complete
MKLVLISFFLIGLTLKINLINSGDMFGEIYTEKKLANNYLAKKYCDSLEKNLFKGLDNESTLKYEYFFSDIPDDFVKNENKFLEIFKSDVKSICSYDISQSNEKELRSFLKKYFITRSRTPKTKVDVINPTSINLSMIPLFR